jgi:hypothetical protein
MAVKPGCWVYYEAVFGAARRALYYLPRGPARGPPPERLASEPLLFSALSKGKATFCPRFKFYDVSAPLPPATRACSVRQKSTPWRGLRPGGVFCASFFSVFFRVSKQ